MDPFANWEGNAASRAQAEALDASRSAGRNRTELQDLRQRVTALENTVQDLLSALSLAGIIEVHSPKE